MWAPVVDDSEGFAFSIRPASGVINPYSSLICELSYYPDYFVPLEGGFDLVIDGGASERLVCKADISTPMVEFSDRRMNFGIIPLKVWFLKVLNNFLRNYSKSAVLINCGKPANDQKIK